MDLLKRFLRETMRDDLMGLASQCAYALVFALFPFLIFLVALGAHLLPHAGAAPVLPPELEHLLPAEIRAILDQRLSELAGRDDSGTIGLALAVALWSAGSGISSLITAINRAYDVAEKRPLWKRKGIALLLTLAGAALVLTPALLGVLGAPLGHLLARFGLGGIGAFVQWLRWPILAACGMFWVMLLFRVAPETSTKWKILTPGALFAVGGIVASNAGLALYLEHAKSMAVTYGALGGFVALLLWLWMSSLALLLGAELNAVLEARRRDAPPKAPLRDTPSPWRRLRRSRAYG